jgi:hypothetical protein
MEPDEVKKILENAETSVEDKVKLLTGLHDTASRGIVQKRDELLGQEKKLKEKIADLEGKASAAETKNKELADELAKNSPEEHKKYYDSQLAEHTAKFQNDLKAVTEERDRFRESHFTRLKKDAIEAGIKDIPFTNDAHKKGFIAIVMEEQFEPKEIDGNTVFLNRSNETIEQAMHKFSLTQDGKAYIKNLNSGGGAQGATVIAPAGANQVTREQFGAMSPQAQMDFVNKGGTVIKP